MRPIQRRTSPRSALLVSSIACLAVLSTACTSSKDVTMERSDSVTTGSAETTGSDVAATDGGTGGGDPTSVNSDDAFGWQNFGDSDAIQTGHLEVPIDYNDPSKGTFDLYVTRHKATNPSKRIGSLLVNPGGPGFGGSDFGIYADQIYSKDLLAHFDIIGWDPRGTGLTTPAIDCITDYDKYFDATDITPDTPDERQQIIDLAKEFETDCATKNAKILQYVGTNNSARDMDTIRKALGEDKITYFGFSYGSELGATWVTLFPDTVRGAVLDGAADPTADFLTSGLQQTKGFENSVDTFLAKCSADDSCAFHNGGNAEKAFDELMAKIDDTPIDTEAGRPPLTRGRRALQAVADAMYTESLWPQLEQALADAQKGDGKGLLELYDSYYQRQPDGTYDNSLEAFQTITCMDSGERLTVAEDDATAVQYSTVAPRFAPSTVGSYFCTFYPKSEDPRVTITGKGAGPVLVVGTTGDPATPLSSTENMAKALEQGELLVVVADQHTGYGVNQCSYDKIDGYLIDLTVPPAGTRCG